MGAVIILKGFQQHFDLQIPIIDSKMWIIDKIMGHIF